MRTHVTRATAVLAAVIAVVFGLALATPGTAAAADGTWRAYGNTNPIDSSPSKWVCADTKTIAPNVFAQVCAIRSADGDHVQGAVIVRNNRFTGYSVTATVDLANSGGEINFWKCKSSGVAQRSWSVCFGQTLPERGSVTSEGWANGEYLEVSPWNHR